MRVAIDQSTIDDVAEVVSSLGSATGEAQSIVSSAGRMAGDLQSGVATLKREFALYREYDAQQKSLQNAKSEIVRVRMELEEKFGINKEIRRYLTGILEASDLSLVKTEIITNCTEKMMMDCRGYWLGPCLVALAAWLDDNKPLADRALSEAMRRDDESTSLLFALVCRRLGRQNASVIWLERYLAMQDPKGMQRRMITVLDAYSNGLFGRRAKEVCEAKIEAWIEEMSNEEGFVEAQQENWKRAIRAKIPGHSYSLRYENSSRYVTNWSKCASSLNETDLHGALLEYFKAIFEKQSSSNMALNDQLDQLLENYVTAYDDEELPLRRRERELELIIEEHGNTVRAKARLDSEQKAMEEILDFTQLLSSAAMHADTIKASNATQRLSIALSKEWILSAYEDVLAQIRYAIPHSFHLSVEGWSHDIVDGTEEEQEKLCREVEHQYTERCKAQLEQMVQDPKDKIWPMVCAGASIFGFIAGPLWGILLLLCAGGLAIRWHNNRVSLERERNDLQARFERTIQNIKTAVRSVCKERRAYIKQINQQDAGAEETLDYIRNIDPVQHMGQVQEWSAE